MNRCFNSSLSKSSSDGDDKNHHPLFCGSLSLSIHQFHTLLTEVQWINRTGILDDRLNMGAGNGKFISSHIYRLLNNMGIVKLDVLPTIDELGPLGFRIIRDDSEYFIQFTFDEFREVNGYGNKLLEEVHTIVKLLGSYATNVDKYAMLSKLEPVLEELKKKFFLKDQEHHNANTGQPHTTRDGAATMNIQEAFAQVAADEHKDSNYG